jgi:leucine dehydrogenase
MALETKHVMGGNTVSHGGDPSPYTALGCFNSMKACLAHQGRKVDFANLTVAIQGCGATGYKLAKLLRQAGAAVLVTDVHVPTMKRAVEELGCVALGNDKNLIEEKVDILAPCARSPLCPNCQGVGHNRGRRNPARVHRAKRANSARTPIWPQFVSRRTMLA